MCFVFVLRPGAKFDARSLLRSVPRTDGAVPVWKWQGPRGEGDPDTVFVYAATVPSSYFVVGNSRDEVLALVRVLSSKGESPLPPALAEAGHKDEPAWGYRRYQHAQTDPMAAGTADVAPGTKALVVVPAAKNVSVRLLGT